MSTVAIYQDATCYGMVVFIIVQNLVGIDAVVLITCMLLFRECGLIMPNQVPKIEVFGQFDN